MRLLAGLGLVFVPFALVACSGRTTGPSAGTPGSALAPPPGETLAQIEIRAMSERPRLAMVSRDGDPAPALVAAFATDLGPAPTVALAALVESRLRASGFDVDTRVDRSAFRVRWLGDAGRTGSFLAALAHAMRDPVVAGGSELALIAQRLEALRRNPLDAPELASVAACTGRLGIAGNEPLPDPKTPGFAAELDAHRRAALHAGRASLAAVGPASFCLATARALEESEGWPAGEAPSDPWPTADTAATYAAPAADGRRARVTVAVRVGDALAAVNAAERLAASSSALRARLSALPRPFRAVEVIGAARPRGGCISVTLEADAPTTDAALERAAARAAAIARHEVRVETSARPSPTLATRQILAAADPREAASRAAWWALSASVANAPPRAAIALGLPPSTVPAQGSTGQTFAAELDRALGATAQPVVERRVAVERGQGELWLLLASPCGNADEGVSDAGATALGLMAAVAAHDDADGVTLEPWIGPEGAGLLAHAAPRDERETPIDLGRRVADAAARALAATGLSPESLREARAATLTHLERTQGRGGAAFEALAGALIPDHPSWLDPFGPFSRVAGAGLEGTALRLRALADGPLRLAVLANADAAQAADVAQAVDRWLVPRDGARTCPPPVPPSSPRPGTFSAHVPRDAALAQALIGASVPAVGTTGHDLAQLTALALGGEGGLLEGALPPASGARATARVVGTGRAAALIVDVRAPTDLLSPAVDAVRALLGRLAQGGLSPQDLGRATALAARRDAESRVEPRRRLIQLWSGRSAGLKETPTPAALSAFLANTLRDQALIVVEARPD